ncbi:MAG: hypothetical protein HY669_04470 [Chloroflexi bacterium]|nr:hypothetical protein [Chloroflexota bacterium]
MTKRFLECEYKPGEELVLRFKPGELPLLPDSTREHLRLAGKETLLAVRSLLDALIDYTTHAEEQKAKQKTKIEVK